MDGGLRRKRTGRRAQTAIVSIVLLVGSSLISAPAAAQDSGSPYYLNDFATSAGPEWSTQTVTKSPTGERFLGRFGVQEVTLTLENLPAESKVLELEFDLYVMGTMDGSNTQYGPDLFTFEVRDGERFQQTTFSNFNGPDNQDHPGDYPTGSAAGGTGADRTDVLGYPKNTPSQTYNDTVYRLNYRTEHVGTSVTFVFLAELRSKGAFEQDESWGIDNVVVALACDIEGTDAGETLTGTDASETICGLGGDDIISGGGGNDTIYAGDGNDEVSGGVGDDVIDGGLGDDDIKGEDGNDTVDGGGGGDSIDGGAGDDVLRGGQGNDVLKGVAGSDMLLGQGGLDSLLGGTQKDVLKGGGGNDKLSAEDGLRDVVDGGPGSKDKAAVDGRDAVSGIEVLL
jgi:Ca2+-binding RTX toxin-like protein